MRPVGHYLRVYAVSTKTVGGGTKKILYALRTARRME